MLRFIAVVVLVLYAVPARSAPFEILVYQSARAFRLTGRITLREPFTDRVLGTYEFVTGGLGRGSAPFGEYEIGAFRQDGWIGRRWEVHQVGVVPGDDGNSAWDPRVHAMRTWIQLHAMHGDGNGMGTFGCFGVYGGPKVWAEFSANLRYLAAWLGVVRFAFVPLPLPLPAFAIKE